MQTLTSLIDRYDVPVDEHLDRDALVPVNTGLQFQGDVAVIPTSAPRDAGGLVPRDGVPVVRGENGGNTHMLLADGPVSWVAAPERRGSLDLGVVTVPSDATAYLAHPEHGYTGIGAGSYTLRRQREQREEIELVAD